MKTSELIILLKKEMKKTEQDNEVTVFRNGNCFPILMIQTFDDETKLACG